MIKPELESGRIVNGQKLRRLSAYDQRFKKMEDLINAGLSKKQNSSEKAGVQDDSEKSREK